MKQTSSAPKPPPMRLACDRCRGQKLRCPRENSRNNECSRCQQAGVTCTFSPSLRLGRPFRSEERQRRSMDKIITPSVSQLGHIMEMSSSPTPASRVDHRLPLPFVNVDFQHMEAAGHVNGIMPFTVNGSSRSEYG